MTLPRILTIMGSGETAPTMVSTHRQLVARLAKPVNATVIDTPYGFQENAGELAERAVKYFGTSVNIDITIAGLLRMAGDGVDDVAVERGLRRVSEADYVFAGPGSPTYALRQWQDSRLCGILAGKLERGGVVTFASAAALTLGSHTVPVYEIYKAGEEPRWETGLDLLGTIGIHAAVVPHYDNAEGGHHDTRFCYLGERRLARLERELPHGHFVLGIDEHTALVLDLDAGTASVTGKGSVTIRLRGSARTFSAGSSFPLAFLREPSLAAAHGDSSASAPADQSPWRDGSARHSPAGRVETDSGAAAGDGGTAESATSLGEAVTVCAGQFDAAMRSRDADGAVRAALALENAMADWSADTTQSDAHDRARAELRRMISALGDAAVGGVQDPRSVVGPFVEAMLAVRRTVRAEKRYDLSDVIRDSFEELGVEVRDTPDGVVWELRD